MQVSYTGYLRWMGRHVDDVPAIIGHAQAVYEAESLPDRWTATKGLGDVVVPIIDDFPDGSMATMSGLELQAFRAAVVQKGLTLEQVERLWPIFETLLPVLLRLIVR